MNISQYLERIQIYEIEKPSYSFPSKLQLQHLLTMPFENFDSDDYLTITEGGTKRKIKVMSSNDCIIQDIFIGPTQNHPLKNLAISV